MDLTDCPGQGELARFAVGDLPRSALARLSGHLEHCAACERALEALDGASDSLLSGLRQLGPADFGRLEPVPLDLVARVRSQRSLGGSAAWLSSGGTRQSLGRFELLEQVGGGSFGYG